MPGFPRSPNLTFFRGLSRQLRWGPPRCHRWGHSRNALGAPFEDSILRPLGPLVVPSGGAMWPQLESSPVDPAGISTGGSLWNPDGPVGGGARWAPHGGTRREINGGPMGIAPMPPENRRLYHVGIPMGPQRGPHENDESGRAGSPLESDGSRSGFPTWVSTTTPIGAALGIPSGATLLSRRVPP